MRRISRFITVIVTLGLLVAALPSSASAQIEDWQRVVRARHAGAVFVQTDGCEQTELYVSASDGKYVNRHGPLNKQGLLGVLYIVRDACAEPGPKGYPVVYSADGMSLDPLVTSPQFQRASVSARPVGTDGDGNAVAFRVDIQWRPTAPFEKSRVSGHAWFPWGEKRGAWVGTWSHNWMAPAMALAPTKPIIAR